MRIIFIFLFIALTLALKDLATVDDSQLGSLLSGDWQSLLPDELQNTKAQLIKFLTPAPSAQPKHLYWRHRHYRLVRG